ncbi:MAG: presenilin family intramembrane aspartyl protease [archaeon]
MKHNWNVTVIILFVFFLTQVVGLYLVNQDITTVQEVNGTMVVEHQETAIGPRPETQGFGSFLYLAIAVIVGTILVLLIIKYKKMIVWKAWFFLAIFFAISIALGVLIDIKWAFLLAFILSALKIWKNNVIIHNFTEVLMYSGLAVLLVPIFDLLWVFVLLIVISLYDMYAVWKSKHMVKMAEFQSKSNLFAGLMIPYSEKKGPVFDVSMKPSAKPVKKKIKNAILGGGDVVFPLIFSGVVMEHLIVNGLSQSMAFFQSIIISVVVSIAVLGLFVFAKKDRFYPAMPVVSIGCIIGYLIILLL